MRVAPPVQAPSCAVGPWRKVQQSLMALSAGVATHWLLSHGFGAGAWQFLASLALGLWAGWLAGRRLTRNSTQLSWDGAEWATQAPGGQRLTGDARPMLDLGTWMLVCFVPHAPAEAGARRAAWLAMRRADAPQAWRALRVALYAPRSGAAGPHPLAGWRGAA